MPAVDVRAPSRVKTLEDGQPCIGSRAGLEFNSLRTVFQDFRRGRLGRRVVRAIRRQEIFRPGRVIFINFNFSVIDKLEGPLRVLYPGIEDFHLRDSCVIRQPENNFSRFLGRDVEDGLATWFAEKMVWVPD